MQDHFKITIMIYLTWKSKFQLHNISEDVVKQIKGYLNTNQARDMDQIPAKFFKGAAHALAYTLIKIFDPVCR